MNIGRKFNPKRLAACLPLAMLLIVTLSATGNYSNRKFFCNSLTAFQDTTGPIRKDTLNRRDSIPITRVDTLNLKISRDSLDAPVNYSASDSVVLDIPTKRVTLYNTANTKYKDLDLTGSVIVLDQPRKLVMATYTLDSLGRRVGVPRFIQGESNMVADTFIYNFETQKGLIKNSFTNQGEIFFYNEVSKKISANEFFALRGRFTTCNLDTPHFAFRTNKLKLVTNKIAVSGPVHPEFEGVPVPLYLPFGYFPISQGRHSGLLPPTFTASEQFGLGLEGLGYYKVLSEYFDVTLRSNIYSYGGYALFLSPSYRKRYRYAGSMNLTYQNTRILGEDPKDPYTSSKDFNITWQHSQDSKARPGTSFSASVNAGSTQFNRYVANNPTRNFSNQMSSSITYSKTWDESKYNLTVSANHQQNNLSRLITLNLPTIGFTAATIYPFQKAEFVGEPKWYEKLGVGLTSNLVGDASFYDSLFSFTKLIDTFTWGAQHNIPIQLSLPPVGPVQISPGISYQQKWYGKRVTRSWNDVREKVDTTVDKGFYVAHDLSFNLNFSTAIFGTFDKFKKTSRVAAFRHVIRPQIGFSYKPDLAKKDYYQFQFDTAGRKARTSYYEGVYPGAFSEGKFGGLNFSLDNNIEMKVRSKTDTGKSGTKIVRLIDGLAINGSYNFFVDSFKLSQFNLSARSTLFDKINITGNAVIDPYQVNDFGQRIDKYMWDGGGSLGRFVGGGVAVSTSFQSKPKEEPKQPQGGIDDDDRIPLTMEEQQAELAYIAQNPSEFADFNIPWSLNISYSYNFTRSFKADYSGFETRSFSSFNWNGDFNLTPRWKLGMAGYYDITTSSIQSLTVYLSREMHCWQLSINVIPVGLYRSFNITLNPKSPLLRDLRVNRTRYFYQ